MQPDRNAQDRPDSKSHSVTLPIPIRPCPEICKFPHVKGMNKNKTHSQTHTVWPILPFFSIPVTGNQPRTECCRWNRLTRSGSLRDLRDLWGSRQSAGDFGGIVKPDISIDVDPIIDTYNIHRLGLIILDGMCKHREYPPRTQKIVRG